ncbi:G-protein coupled receptor 54-like [Anneissia japonica]|uniref:G-protein coupled receptor 54-like n=1 Tax=Anneissia japonica TaxID=1529436 RepID=UPI001425B0D9|nr:G-protein coupled receptor 54-like [Anneissia japonica]XP_033127542.1 G-protein coupled receptor 54-like [Anneissia japonica]XP_033127550.1 G-protein coupled receptor 54-like [Anneissia japonica]
MMAEFNISNETDVQCIKHKGIDQLLVPIVFMTITCIGVIGNGLVIYVIVKNKAMKTATNYYILNLAITDVAFLSFCAPLTAAMYISAEWLYGRFLCKFFYYMMQVTAQATCLTLTAMSLDRFQVIVWPLKSLKGRSTAVARVGNIVVWTVSGFASLPVAFYYDVIYNRFACFDVCFENWPSTYWKTGYTIYSAFALYIIPVVVISVCYSVMLRVLWRQRIPLDEQHHSIKSKTLYQKRKITRMVLAVVILFVVCWLPQHVLVLWIRLDSGFPYGIATYTLKTTAHIMAYLNSCVNPFVYAFMGENFRNYFRKAFPICCKQSDVVPDTRVLRPTTKYTRENGARFSSRFAFNTTWK